METKTKRIALFSLCMLTRFSIAYIAFKYTALLPALGYIAIIPAIGFAVIYMGGYRKTGAEVFGDRIWWNNLRPIHAAIYATFAYLAIHKSPHAWKLLVADASLGLLAFIHHHFF